MGLEQPGPEKYAVTRGTILDPGRDYSAELPQRERLCIGLARMERSRTELFTGAKGVAATMQQRVFRTPGCGGEAGARC